MYDLTIRGGRVVTGQRVVVADIGIRHGRIAAIVEHPPAQQQQPLQQPLLEPGSVDIDARGLVVAPGGVDSHCHIEQKTSTGLTPTDDFYSASVAALCGGTTTLVPFACQHRGARVLTVVDDYRAIAAKSACDYALHIIVADPAAPHAVSDLTQLFGSGFSSVKVYVSPFPSQRLKSPTHHLATSTQSAHCCHNCTDDL